ncbi:MAG: hypothetical protein RLZZ555_817 [Pseudomonadota bacterium]|jgi:hypothetical protein
MSTQDELKFRLSADAEQAVSEMNKTAEAINRTTEAMRGLGGATSGADRAGQSLTGAAGAASGAAGALGRTGSAAQGAGRTMAEAAQEADRLGESLRRMQNTRPLDAARDIIGVRSFATIQRDIDLVTAAYGRLARSGKLSEQELAVANQATQASVARLRAEMQTLEQAHGVAGMSAKQYAQAMRNLPMQMTDVAVSLASGMPVWMVAIQQGGQLKDAFGGVGAMARVVGGYVLGMANPFVIAAAAGGLLFAAFESGRAEAAALNNALATTGGASGQTIDDLMGMAAAIDQVAGTQGKAAEVIGMLVSSGKVGADGIQQFATAAILAERNLGIEAEQTVAKFAELGRSPVDAVKKLNDGLNFLTAATYAEIKALQDQGRTAEAAALAQNAYAAALESRAKSAAENVGLLERAWKGIKDAASEAWDAMLDIGRPDSLEKKIADAQKRVLEQRRLVASGGPKGLFGESVGGGLEQARADLAEAEAEAAALVAQRKAQTAAADKAASDAKVNADGVAARDYLDRLQGQSDKVGALNKELAEYRRNVAAAAAAGQAVSTADQARDEKFIRDKYATKPQTAKPDAMPEAQRRLAEAEAKAASESLMRLLDLEQQQLESQRARGLLSLDAYETQQIDIKRRRLDQEEALINRRIEIEKGRKVKDAADGVTQQATLTDLGAQRNRVRDQRADLPTVALAGQQARDLQESQRLMQEWAASTQQAVERVRALEGETAASMAQLITDPMQRARAEAEATARATERAAADALVSLRAQIDVLRGSGLAAEADSLAQQAERIAQLSRDKARDQRQAPGQKAANEFINAELKIDIGDGFGAASQSMSALVKSFEQLNEQQRLYNQAKQAEGLTAEQVSQIEAKHLRSQIAGYASVAGAAKGLLKEKTAGYKILDAAEKAARAYEIAMAVQTAARKTGLIAMVTGAKVAGDEASVASSVASVGPEVAASMEKGQAAAAAGVAGQAQGDPYSAFVRIAAMTALMAALGFAVSGGKGGGSVAPKNTGTGTVLGDKDAQSESLGNAVTELTKVNRITMEHSAGMLASLRNIESSIAGVGALISRGGAFSSVVSGITEGKSGGISFLGGLFGTKTTINSQGLQAGPQTMAQILDSGSLDAQFFAEVTKKKTFRRAKTSTTTTEADATTESQLGMVFRDIASSLSGAAGALGAPLADVENRIRGFTVNLGKIDLKGLSGKEIGERLSAVIGAESDRIAEAALPGLAAWQKVGEGYYQTAIRVSAGVEEAGGRLRRLGVAAVALADVANTQGDAAAEIVRESILQSEEGLRAGLSEIVETLDGSAEDIADTFKTLRDARRSLELVGLGAADVTRAMLDAAGGLDELASGLSDYESSILSETEQQAAKTGRLADEFKRLGVAMPATKAQFKALVESASKDTSEAGQRLLGGLLPLSSAFAEVAESVADASSALEDEIKRIRGLISDETATTASLQSQFALKTAQARAGDAAALEALPDLSRALLDKTAETAGSREELVREQAAVAASLEQTLALSRGKTTTTATATETTQTAETAATVAVQTATTEATSTQPAAQAATTLQPADIEALRSELAEVGRRIAALTEQQQSIGLAVADSTARTARVLERVTPDGDAIATRATA